MKKFCHATLVFLIVAVAHSSGQPSTNDSAIATGGRVDSSTIFGKVLCGYQGWFGVPGDGGPGNGWQHWTKNWAEPLADGNAKIDLWPDVSELSPAERFQTGFKFPDGRPAEVFSSRVKPTVLRHFRWMQEYGIDGVFVQRFAVGLTGEGLERNNAVLSNCREGAENYGRTYAIMYDLSGLTRGRISQVMDDWRALRKQMAITKDRAYLSHRQKPVVAIWGIGFNDHRDYTLDECKRLVEFFKNDPDAGGCTVMLGVPTYWRELKADAVSDPQLLEIILMADIVSPWTVGRFANTNDVQNYAATTLAADAKWCRERGIDYMPVVFPGFSWHNMTGGLANQIPRLRGQFLWSQFCAVRRAGISTAYVAMFDEVDEGTAIFKCVNEVPTGQKSQFVTLEGLPSDFYLKLVGKGKKMIGGEIPLSTQINSNIFSASTKETMTAREASSD